jgi:hypothetical protein
MPQGRTAGFKYRIRPDTRGWRWTTFDPDGRVCDQGAAPSRAVAAAFVIRHIARSAAESAG